MYCGIYGAFNVNEDTYNVAYFYKWFAAAGPDRFSLTVHGDHFFQLACTLQDEGQALELAAFLLRESRARRQPFDISAGVAHTLSEERFELARLVLVDNVDWPIDVKVLKKWHTILSNRWPYGECGEAVEWIKNRPEMRQCESKSGDDHER